MNFLLMLALLVFATLFSATGMLFLKLSAEHFRFSVPALLRNRKFLLGGALYAASLIIYLGVLKELPVSLAYPLTSMNYVWVTILSIRFLRERVDAWRWGGVGLIIAGIVLLAL